jgi:hypothetical protein
MRRSFKTDFFRHEQKKVDDIIPEPLEERYYDRDL